MVPFGKLLIRMVSYVVIYNPLYFLFFVLCLGAVAGLSSWQTGSFYALTLSVLHHDNTFTITFMSDFISRRRRGLQGRRRRGRRRG